MKIKAVVFDLDGTLLDTIEDLTDSMNAALAQLSFPGHTVEACKKLVGEGVEHFARSALPAVSTQDENLVARCVELMKAEYRQRWSQKTRPYDGIPELLAALAAAGIKLAVLSNKADDFTRLMVSHFFPDSSFDLVVGARSGRARKPDPSTAREIAENLGVLAGETILLGDTKTDMETARRADMIPIGALWGFRSAAELRGSGARAMINQPEELLDLLT